MRTHRMISAGVAAALLLTACASDEPTLDANDLGETADAADDEAVDETTGDATDDAADSGEAAAEDGPAVVTLSPAMTEMMYGLEAGDLVVAADSLSDFPAEAPAVEDLSAFEPNAEAIAGFEPDLVVMTYDPSDIVAQLDALGIDSLLLEPPTTFEQVLDQIIELGEAVGHGPEAIILTEEMREGVDAAAAEVEGLDGTTYHYDFGDGYLATDATFQGDILNQMGLSSIATPEDLPVSDEFVLAADPDVIIVTSQEAADELAARPGFDELSAVQNERFIIVGTDISSRWGPRLVEFAESVAEQLSTLLVDA